MKMIFGLLFLSLMTQAATLKLNSTSSKVGFEIAKFKIGSAVPGTFEKVEGTGTVDDKTNELKDVKVTIQVGSINTQDEKRDAHLKSADFFDAEKNPTMTFVQMEKVKLGKSFDLKGNLTMKGVTKPVVLKVTRSETKEKGYVFNAVTEINRQDFGVSWNKDLGKGEAKSVFGMIKDKVLDDMVKINLTAKFE